MQRLISREAEVYGADARHQVMDFIRLRRDEITNIKQRTPPKKPPPPKKLPAPPPGALKQKQRPVDVQLDIEVPTLDLSGAAGGGPYLGNWRTDLAAAEGDVIPIVRTPPQWPREALINGTSGWVRIEFTILEDGTVKDPKVVESQPPRLFDRNAVRAILRWKFKPRIVDGQPVQRQAEQTIEFKIEDKQS
jgi:protein TonB